MSKMKIKIAKLPSDPGVYIFKDKAKNILYIGKATNLKSRVASYFRGAETRNHIEVMMPKVADIDFQKTDSVLEALILESNLIKKYQPKYNIELKDDKSFSYFVITKEEFSRVLILRKTEIDFKKLQTKNYKLRTAFGPYTFKKQMEVALKIIRRIFPFHSNKQETEKGCLDFQLGLCPGPHAGAITLKDYQKNIHGIQMILEGKKKNLVKTLEKEMQLAAKNHEFEKAAEIRNKVFALNHIRDVALISKDFEIDLKTKKHKLKTIRIEAYDISNISGKNAVGSMVVFEGGQPNKSQYRKFKIRTVEGINDIGMMQEVLLRRFKNDWPMPHLILLDGGQGHLNMAEKLLRSLGIKVPIIAVAKGPTRKTSNFQFLISDLWLCPAGKQFPITEFSNDFKKIADDRELLGRIIDEAHRFAIGYHRKMRKSEFLTK